MSTKDLRTLLDQLDTELALLSKSKESLEAMKLSGHQIEISVRVGDRTFDLTWLGRETGWMSRLIRGREMLMLGAKKLVSAEVDARHDRVTEIRRQIAQAAESIA